jgi:hypothetical protein
LTERRDIGSRLENWARWATARGRRGADCMTGAICDSMRRSALGDVWSGHEVSAGIDAKDAARIQAAMPRVPIAQRVLLNWCYIEQARPEIVARKCSFPVREFVERFRAAQAAVEDATDDLDSGNR